jgi:hypothetical protein
LVKELQLARENSFLGEYEKSQLLFKQIITKIQFQIKKNINDQSMYDRWDQFQHQIQDEISCVENLINIQRQLAN